MKTRRIHLQPGEPVEIFNVYGTSILKATAMFDRDQTIVVTYPQPGVPIYSQETAAEAHALIEPLSRKPERSPQVPEQFSLLDSDKPERHF